MQSDGYKEVIFRKYEWNTNAWAKFMYLRHVIENLLGLKIHTKGKIAKFCQYFRGTKNPHGLNVWNKYNFKNNFVVRFMYEHVVAPG